MAPYLWHGHGNFVAQQDICAGTLPSAATDTFLVLCGALRADAHTATLHSLVEVAKRFVVSGKLADVIVGSGGQRADRTVRRCHVLLGIRFRLPCSIHRKRRLLGFLNLGHGRLAKGYEPRGWEIQGLYPMIFSQRLPVPSQQLVPALCNLPDVVANRLEGRVDRELSRTEYSRRYYAVPGSPCVEWQPTLYCMCRLYLFLLPDCVVKPCAHTSCCVLHGSQSLMRLGRLSASCPLRGIRKHVHRS
jgi:hypothetical protein